MRKKMWFKRTLGMFLSIAIFLQSGAAFALPEDDIYAIGDSGVAVWITDSAGENVTYGELSIDVAGGTINLFAQTEDTASDNGVTWSADSSAVSITQSGNDAIITAVKNTDEVVVTATSNEDDTAVAEVYIQVTNQENSGLDYGINLLFIGNSIMKHPPKPSDLWYGNWGMAASSEDKDYVHLLLSKITNRFSEPEWDYAKDEVRSTVTMEKIPTGATEAEIGEHIDQLIQWIGEEQFNVINVQCGENWGADQETRTAALTYFVENVKELCPNVIINLCVSFWAQNNMTNKDYAAKKTVADRYDYVYFSETGIAPDAFVAEKKNPIDNPYCAYDRFPIGGIAAHPGDAGMAELARIMFETLEPAIASNFEPAVVVYPTSIKLEEGQSVTVDGGTLTMIPSIAPSNAAKDLLWSVDNENIATISKDGVLTAKNNGTVKVTVTSKYDDSVKASVNVVISNQSACYTLKYAAASTDTGVTNLPEDFDYAKGIVTLEDKDIPEREAYIFEGWSLTEGGDVIETLNVTADTTLYAVWREATDWSFEKRIDGFTVDNAFNTQVTGGTLMTIATGMTEDALLTVNSPVINVNPAEYNTLTINMSSTIINTNTSINLNVKTANNTYTFNQKVTSTAMSAYMFNLEEITEPIIGFSFQPANIDTYINIDRINFSWRKWVAEKGYYSIDILDGKAYEGDDISFFPQFAPSVDTTVAHDGKSSVKLSGGNGYRWFSTDLSLDTYQVEPGDALNVSAWIKKSDSFAVVNNTGNASYDKYAGKISFSRLLYYYIYDLNGTKYNTTNVTIGTAGDMFVLKDSEEWQYVSENFTLQTPEIPAGATITGLHIELRPRDGVNLSVTGDMWVDQFSVKRIPPYGLKLNKNWDEIGEAGLVSGGYKYPDAVLENNIVHDGKASYKYTGTGTALLEKEYKTDLQVTTNKIRIKQGFWIKLSQEWIESAKTLGMRVWTTFYSDDIVADANGKNIGSQGWSPIINVENTTNWQYVEIDNEYIIDRMPEKGGVISKIYNMIRLGDGFNELTIPTNGPIYFDGYEFSIPTTQDEVATKLISQDKISKADGTRGVRLVFNDGLMNSASISKGTFIVNEKINTNYTISVLEDGNTFDLYFENVDKISSFKAESLKNTWGYNVSTITARDSINQDKFFDNILPGNYSETSGVVKVAMTGSNPFRTVDITEKDGNKAVKVSPEYNETTGKYVQHVELFSYTIPTEVLETLGDTIKLSFKMKRDEGAVFPDVAATGMPLTDVTSYTVNTYAVYKDADGKQARVALNKDIRVQDVAIDSDTWYSTECTVNISAFESLIPADATETEGLYFDVRPLNGGFLALQGGSLYFDEIKMTRVMPNEYLTNFVGDAGYEAGDNIGNGTLSTAFGMNGKAKASVDTTTYHSGGASVKITGGTTGNGIYSLDTFAGNVIAENEEYYVSFWLKKTANTGENSMRVMLHLYSELKDWEGDGTGDTEHFYTNIANNAIPIADTTEWQKVTVKLSFNLADTKQLGSWSSSKAPAFMPGDKVRTGNVRISTGTTKPLPDGEAIWLDQIEVYKVPSSSLYGASRIESQTAILSEGAISGVQMTFNSEFITESALQNAIIKLDGKATQYTVVQSADKKTATFTFKNPANFEKFEIIGLTDRWGNDVVTTDELTLDASSEEPLLSVDVEYTTIMEGDTIECTKQDFIDNAANYKKVYANVSVANAEEGSLYDVVLVKKVDGVPTIIQSTTTDLNGKASIAIDNDLTEATDVIVYVWETVENMIPVTTPISLK